MLFCLECRWFCYSVCSCSFHLTPTRTAFLRWLRILYDLEPGHNISTSDEEQAINERIISVQADNTGHAHFIGDGGGSVFRSRNRPTPLLPAAICHILQLFAVGSSQRGAVLYSILLLSRHWCCCFDCCYAVDPAGRVRSTDLDLNPESEAGMFLTSRTVTTWSI